MRVKRRRQRREDGDGGAENDPQDVAGVREALAVAVEAVARAADGPGTDVAAEYAEQRWRMPLEARRDSRGGAVPLGRNAIGEHYASYSSPMSYTRGKTAAEIFARMKMAVREDIRTRDARRIAALNQQERERKQRLIDMGYLSPDAVLEARFDHLLRRESSDPTA